MTRAPLTSLIVVWLVTIVGTFSICSAADFQRISPLRWVDPLDRAPISPSEFLTARGVPAPLQIRLVTEVVGDLSAATTAGGRPNLVALYVQVNLVSALQASLDTYMADLSAEGFTVQLHSLAGGTAQGLRSHLQTLQSQGLVGAVLVGDLPCAWYEMDDYWGGEHEEFPIDLYLMDLNGTWSDSDADGLYNNHTGNVSPEIWLGRIDAGSLMAMDELSALQNYFAKNHAYRIGQLSLPRRALAFEDDDWSYSGDCGLSYIYDDITLIDDPYQTTATNYRSRLLTGYEFIHLMSHSNPWGHAFLAYSDSAGCFFNYDLDILSAQAFFYNLFACSNARFVELDNIGNYYIFQDDYGLAVIGSTKTGSMLDFEQFYAPLGSGDCLGRSFLLWFQFEATYGFDDYERSWFYGMTMLGDPTLLVNQSVARRREIHGIAEKEVRSSGTRQPLIGNPLSSSSESDGRPVLCAGSAEKMMAVWVSGDEGRASICSNYYNGVSWSGQRLVQSYLYWEAEPALALNSSGEFWAFFPRFLDDEYDYDLMSSRWTGTGWSQPQILFRRNGYDLRPTATNFNGALQVAWQSWGNAQADIFWMKQNGSSWTSPACLTESDQDDVDPFLLNDADDRLWLTWSTRERGCWDVAVKVYSQLWSESRYLTDGTMNAYDPMIATDGAGNLWLVCVVFSDGGSDLAAYYYDGENWAGPEWVTRSTESEYAPCLVINQGIPTVAFYRKTADRTLHLAIRGATGWSIEPLEDSAGKDMDPSFALDSDGDAWLAWCTDREGDTDVFAAHLVLPTPPPTITPEPTSIATPTPATSDTPAPSTTPDSTESPTPVLTPTPTCTSSPVETSTPTPIVSVTIDIRTNQTNYTGGDNFELRCEVNTNESITVDHYIVLDVQASYWFWPMWGMAVDSERRTYRSGMNDETILAFIWPMGAGQLEGVRFWTALLDPITATLIGNLDYCDFSFE